jgi:UDP-N-acetylmuramoyl-tripeptide--D-alanyl-D-alanine ligase
VAVLEMGGAYAFGELALLASIAEPRIGVVTNVHPVHLERMGTIENIAITKAELVQALPPDGVAVLNGDDVRVRAMAGVTPARVVTFGVSPHNDVWADRVQTDGLSGVSFRLHLDGEVQNVSVPMIGGHAVELALSAIAVGSVLGMDLSEMLPGFEDPSTQVRLIVTPGPRGAMLIDDTYNASTPSVMSALNLLAELTPGRRIAVLGDMREMGEITEQEHRLVGRRVAEVVDELITYGELARIIAEEAERSVAEGNGRAAVRSFRPEERAELLDYLMTELDQGDIVLLKGSRGLRMEEFVTALQQAATDSTTRA